MSVKIRVKNNYLYLDTIVNRKHIWESLHIKLSTNRTIKKEQLDFAESCRAQRELQLAQREWGALDTIASKQTLLEYYDNYCKDKCLKTCTSYLNAYKLLAKYKYGNVKLFQVNLNWIHEFYSFLKEDKARSTFTNNLYLKRVKTVVLKAYKEGIINKNPFINFQFDKVKDKTEKKPLTSTELEKFVKAKVTVQQQRAKNAFLFACYTGLRISDLISLEYKDIVRKELSKENSFEYWIHKKQVKTSRYVDIPLLPQAREIINDGVLHLPNDKVFRALDHRDNRLLKRIAENIGLDTSISWHTARHTFATIAIEYGLNPLTVQKLLGHTRLDTTAIYAVASDTAKSKDMEKLEGVI